MATQTQSSRPDATEFPPFFARYVANVPETDVLGALRDSGRELDAALTAIPDARGGHRYAPDKWTIREVIGHMIDAERVFAYRAVTFARNDKTALPSFDENVWAANATFDSRTVADLVDELEAVRSSTIHLAKHLNLEEQERRGTASGQPVTVRALLYIIAGHERHHVAILRERYLSQS